MLSGGVLVVAILLAVPGQPRVVFGIEVMALSVLTAVGLFMARVRG